MPKITVQLRSAGLLFIDTEDAPWGRVVFSETNLRDLTTDILNELQRKFGTAKVRLLAVGEPPLAGSRGIIESTKHRIARTLLSFGSEFGGAEEKLLEELGKAVQGDGVFVLQVGYSNESTFATENRYEDYLYLFARLVRKDH